MSDNLSGLISNVLTTLMSPSARKINFYAGFWPINPVSFVAVDMEIVKRMFYKREGIEITVGKLPEGAGAMYNYRDDAYVFKNNTYGTKEAHKVLIIHESVHAWIDIQGYKSSPNDADNEAAAYVTGSLFSFYAFGRGVLDLADLSTLPETEQTVYAVADGIAATLKDTAGPKLSDRDRQHMVDAVVASPVYQKLKITRHTPLSANGIREFRHFPSDYLMYRGI